MKYKKYIIFRLSVPPRGHAYGEIFATPEPGSIHEKVFNESMDQHSFIPLHHGLHLILNKPKHAYFHLSEPVNSLTEFHCKVNIVSIESN